MVLISPDVSDKNDSHGTKMARCCTAALRYQCQSLFGTLPLLDGHPDLMATGAYIPPVIELLFLAKIHAEVAVQTDDGMPTRPPQCLHPHLRERPETVKLQLAPSSWPLALPLQFDQGHIVVQRQALQKSATVRVCLHKGDPLPSFLQKDRLVHRLLHMLHTTRASQVAPPSEDVQ